ncbi:MAG: site-specific DNA-methyltransferase [Desulfobacteraceae bacterium]|nr:site-specific DNA-methyltransferase [Desulfobacteraceae bacterium]
MIETGNGGLMNNPTIIGDATFYLGDCLNILPELPENSIDAVVTDPPYSSGGQFRGDRIKSTISKYVQTGSPQNIRSDFSGDNRDQRSFFAWSTLWLTATTHIVNPGGILCCFSDWRQIPVMSDSIQAGGWTWRNLCTWWKPGCRMQKGRFSSSAEYILYATNGPHASDGEKSPQNVISRTTLLGDQKEHIAEKPIEVVQWACSVVRKKGTVLDPFLGSGTTAIACYNTGRKFIGIEKEKKYFDIAVARYRRETAQMRIGDLE